MLKKPKNYCVIGYPVTHSLSPKVHNAAFRRYKIKAHYEACEVKPEKLGVFMRLFRKQFAGGNVTIPHKEKVMKYLDLVSPEAKAIGAVNTIVNKEGRLLGYNTDMQGAMSAISRAIKNLRGKNALVLGAGGAARAVVYGLKKAGAKVLIANRTFARAKKLAREFHVHYIQLEKLDLKNIQLIVNTTSVGMRPHAKDTPLPNLKLFLKGFKKKPVVMDIVYRPRMTKLLRDAKKAGCQVVTGDKMFLGQAAAAFTLWTGRNFHLNYFFTTLSSRSFTNK